jgi:hypothetical protein
LYRAGLSENLEYLHKDTIMLAEWAVSGTGDLVRFERRRPSVLLDARGEVLLGQVVVGAEFHLRPSLRSDQRIEA